ncbi:MAG: NFACT family protein [Spirochaetaceae bacterium]|jgi:predicted ribosome quality control (RQC) complex YloA/Tae2 family protein|nr:NFACT family protein [Spirochaetaceae bacterium]
MSLNWKEIDLILHELDLPGMQIQKVWQSAFDVLAMQLYGGKDGRHSRLILVSLSPLACRIHETFRAVPKSEKPLRFAEFLKSRIVNGRIEEAVQLGDNRIIRIVVRRGEAAYRLYIRLWSNAANVIVTGEDNIILDAMKRLPKRGEIGGGAYSPEQSLNAEGAAAPEKQNKKYEVRELPGEGSFNSRVDAWYAEHGGRLSLEQLREEVKRSIGKNRNRLEAALERLREKEADYSRGERFKEYGDIILSCAPAEGPSCPEGKGSSWIEAESFSSPGCLIRIEIDPRKSPAKNAEAYYEKYRKAKTGLSGVQEEIAAGKKELEKILLAEKQLLEETNPIRLEALLRKLRRGLLPDSAAKTGKPTGGKKRPGIGFADGDWLILVGRDAAENDELLRRHVKGNDLWLHARDWAGSYVFIKNRPGKSIPLEILLDAANLALFYSKGRNNKKGDLYYTQVKFLRRAKNGPKGLVIPTQEKNLSVTLEEARLKRLEDARV